VCVCVCVCVYVCVCVCVCVCVYRYRLCVNLYTYGDRPDGEQPVGPSLLHLASALRGLGFRV
jgi:hypothetical protein